MRRHTDQTTPLHNAQRFRKSTCALFFQHRITLIRRRCQEDIFADGRRTEILSFKILSKNLPEIGPVQGRLLLNISKFDRVPEHVTVGPALNRKY